MVLVRSDDYMTTVLTCFFFVVSTRVYKAIVHFIVHVHGKYTEKRVLNTCIHTIRKIVFSTSKQWRPTIRFFGLFASVC